MTSERTRTGVEDLAASSAQLVLEVDTLERYTWHEHGARKERREHRTHRPGLLLQLHALAGLTGGVAYGEGGHTRPGSRTPAGSAYVDELARITTGIYRLRAALAREQGFTWQPGGSAAEALEDIGRLAETAKGRDVDTAVRQVSSWVSAARVLLQYQAAAVELQTCCPDCAGRLRVRADASSDVWCAGLRGRIYEGPAEQGRAWPMVDLGCGARWPRIYWLELAEKEQAARLGGASA